MMGNALRDQSHAKPLFGIATAALLCCAPFATAQSVGLPAPRLLTLSPMGGQAGTSFDVVATGDSIRQSEALLFSNPAITAKPKLDDAGIPVENTFVVSIDADCPPGVYDAHAMARLGVSSARAFSVSSVPESNQTKACTSVDSAYPIDVDTICNAVVAARAVNHYRFTASAGQRLLVDCVASGIDSKLKPVLIVADSRGNDLVAERRGGSISFTAPESGEYLVKLHDLTFRGGPHYFARLTVRSQSSDDDNERLPSVQAVNEFSWPPNGLAERASSQEDENAEVQQVTLPVDIAGRFYPAADADTYEFEAKAGQTWWVEVASERLGRPTDPFVVVQRVGSAAKDEVESATATKKPAGNETEPVAVTLVDVVELADIASPVKRSSNGYAYDGPPYNAGSSDVLGKIDIPEDGRYRLTVSDLFGGTRSNPENSYRLIVRKAAPDFALVGWALHMQLRNGDRNALSKPIALRSGATIPFEIVVVRRDGFDGPIDLKMTGLPEGVTATGLRIGPKQSRGILLVHAALDAPRGLAFATITGTATVDEHTVTRPCHLASMKWPVTNARNEIPAPRLLANIPVSVGGAEDAGLAIAAADSNHLAATEGQSITIPLRLTKRGEFSGKTATLSTFGYGFEKTPKFDVTIADDEAEAVLDLAKLKTTPGVYQIAFYGGAVEKYRDNVDAVEAAEAALADIDQQLETLKGKLSKVVADETGNAEKLAAKQTALTKERDVLERRLKSAERQAQPKDIVDIVVSDVFEIEVRPAEDK